MRADIGREAQEKTDSSVPARRTGLTWIQVVLNSYTFAFTALTHQNVCCEKGLLI